MGHDAMACARHASSFPFTRRGALAALGACALMAPASAAPLQLPAEVAGVDLPRSDIALRALRLSQAICPDFLFNHCMRIYLFGALHAKKSNIVFNAEEAFVAAALHDVGLIPARSSANNSFEIDGANAAEAFARENGLDAAAADVVWRAIACHDGRFALTRRQGPEAIVVAVGAATDVNGPGDGFTAEEIAAIVAAFPRLRFTTRFTALLVDQCRRKPLSQSGTWLEGLCRERSPSAWPTHVEHSIAASQFAE